MNQFEQDKLRFQQQMAEFEEKGYFTLPDGNKSVGDFSNIQQKDYQMTTGKLVAGQLANDLDDATTVTTNTQLSTNATSS